ncbi:MAG: hypothetical protein AAF566_11635 [Pseudomonadota bacterium]
MDQSIFEAVAAVAGIGGIGLAVFYLLFRDLIRKSIFPKLSKKDSYRVILIFMGLVWSVSVIAMVLWRFETLQGADNGSVEIQDFIVSEIVLDEEEGLVLRNLDVLINNSSGSNELATHITYSRGASSVQMQMITACCMGCMSAWYVVDSGEIPSLTSPGSQSVTTVNFVSTGEQSERYWGRLFLARGCTGNLFAQLSSNLAVVLNAGEVTQIRVSWPLPTAPDEANEEIQGRPLDDGFDSLLRAERDEVCVFLRFGEREESFCRAYTNEDQLFL